MAKATKDVFAPGIVRLALSVEEAQALRILTGVVSGSTTKSARKHTQQVYNALTLVGVSAYDTPEYNSLGHTPVVAKDYPEPAKPVESFDVGEVYESAAGYKYLRTRTGKWYDLDDRCKRVDGYPSRPMRKLS
jgi:hypothetical protein